MSIDLTILVLAKTPRPGTVKTRLIPAYGDDGAAQLAMAALHDTLAAVARSRVTRRLLVLDGPATFDLPAGIAVIPQATGSLDQRIAAALATITGPAMLIGMDTPQVTPQLLELDLIGTTADAWLGPAADGGWWALGLRHPARDAERVCLGIPMSTVDTGQRQRERLINAGLHLAILPTLHDVDTPEDASVVAAQAPGTRFAHAVTRLNAPPPEVAP